MSCSEHAAKCSRSSGLLGIRPSDLFSNSMPVAYHHFQKRKFLTNYLTPNERNQMCQLMLIICDSGHGTCDSCGGHTVVAEVQSEEKTVMLCHECAKEEMAATVSQLF